jgi:alpha-glucuronidase
MRITTLFLSLWIGGVVSESGIDAWLRYAPLPGVSTPALPKNILVLNTTVGSPVNNAGLEVQKGFRGIFDKKVFISAPPSKSSDATSAASSAVVVGTVAEYQKTFGNTAHIPALGEDGFWLSIKGQTVQILGQNERGTLYGAFEYLSMLAQGNFSNVAFASSPNAPIRWVNQWDNMDGSIERGYGGFSLFFFNGLVVGQ